MRRSFGGICQRPAQTYVPSRKPRDMKWYVWSPRATGSKDLVKDGERAPGDSSNSDRIKRAWAFEPLCSSDVSKRSCRSVKATGACGSKSTTPQTQWTARISSSMPLSCLSLIRTVGPSVSGTRAMSRRDGRSALLRTVTTLLPASGVTTGSESCSAGRRRSRTNRTRSVLGNRRGFLLGGLIDAARCEHHGIETRRVDDRGGQRRDVNLGRNPVAGRAANVRDDRLLPTGQGIQQRALARVGRTDQGDGATGDDQSGRLAVASGSPRPLRQSAQGASNQGRSRHCRTSPTSRP